MSDNNKKILLLEQSISMHNLKIFLLILALFTLKPEPASSYDYFEEEYFYENSGPIPIRNQTPLHLLYLQMVPDKAKVVEKDRLSVEADYTASNTTASAFTPVTSLYNIQIDLEANRATFDFRYGLYDNLEIGLEIAYLSFSYGYLDNFIESFEDGIGANTPRSRERQGSYEFDYTFIYNNKYLIYLKHSVRGIGDMVLNAKYQFLEEDIFSIWPNMSLRTAVKFPTADKDDLLGSGEFDYGVGLLMDKTITSKFFVYAGINAVRIKKPSFFSEIELQKEFYSGMVAAEYFFKKRVSFITQLSGNTTPYPFSDTNVLDNDAYEFTLGLNYIWKEKNNISWHLALTENIVSASSPDFTWHAGFLWNF